MDTFEKLHRERERLAKKTAKLQADLEAVQAELAEVEAAERVLQRLEGAGTPTFSPVAPPRPKAGGKSKGRQKITVKEAVIEALKAVHPQGLMLRQIRDFAHQHHGMNLNPNSVGGTLYRLKETGDVRIDGLIWYHVPNEPENAERPDASPNGTSGPSSRGLVSHQTNALN